MEKNNIFPFTDILSLISFSKSPEEEKLLNNLALLNNLPIFFVYNKPVKICSKSEK